MSLFGSRVPTSDASAPPTEGFERYSHIVGTHIVGMIGLSFLFCITSLPVLTLPASIGALCHVTSEWEKGNGIVSLLSEYFHSFTDRFMDRLVTYLGTVSIPSIVYILLASIGFDGPICTGVMLALWLLMRTVYDWLGMIIEEINIPFGAAIKDSIILFFTEWKRSLAMLLSLVAEAALLWFLYPYCLLAFFFFLFSARQLMVARMCYRTVMRRVGGVEINVSEETDK